jgi:hypothetical protein
MGDASTCPLIVIKEVLMEDDANMMDVDDKDQFEVLESRAVCEYGVTIVDSVTGVVTLGQFADDVLRSRMQTLLARFGPSEVSEKCKAEDFTYALNYILPEIASSLTNGYTFNFQVIYEGGQSGASKTLINFLKLACPPSTVIEVIHPKERFPKSTAVDANVRRMLDRTNMDVKPWDVTDALGEVHRRGYYSRSSRSITTAEPPTDITEGIGRWPEILRACIEGSAMLALSSFGAALFYLQRILVDAEILSLGIIKAYSPPNISETTTGGIKDNYGNAHNATNPSDGGFGDRSSGRGNYSISTGVGDGSALSQIFDSVDNSCVSLARTLVHKKLETKMLAAGLSLTFKDMMHDNYSISSINTKKFASEFLFHRKIEEMIFTLWHAKALAKILDG